MKFIQALQHCINNNLVFAAYRLPHSDAVRLIVQKNPRPEKVEITSDLLAKKGFLVAPFIENEKNHSYFIQPDLNYISTDYVDFDALFALKEQSHNEALFENESISKIDFIEQVEKIKAAIKNGVFEKAVISRIKLVERNYRSKLTEIFQLLSASYSNAFVYLFNVAGQLWMGATPEPLICSHKNELETVSLAGTREFNPENMNLHNWSRKELVEQEMVTRFIEKTLEKFEIHHFQKNGPYTKKAGNLVHLRTDFTLDFHKVNGQLGNLVKELHPTSAVCGLPKKESMDFIVQLEKPNRSYYSGFLGPVNLDERILLYVNLRCMQVLCDRLVLHIGAGITCDSVPEDEWAETEIKADTLLSIIHKV
ncbi:MAG: chorismate-binding protein [Prolixibacteraceae bacterium]